MHNFPRECGAKVHRRVGSAPGDEKGLRHWKTEIVATTVEMLSGRKKKDYAEEAVATEVELE